MNSSTGGTFAALFVWSAWLLGVAVGQELDQVLPPTMKVLIEQAEEDFFDGDLESAERRVDEAYDWVRANKNQIARTGGDHTLLEAMLAGLYAEIFHASGDTAKADAKLKHAEKLLEIRKTVFIRNRLFPPFLWQFDAFIKCTRGDVNRPTPDFGLAENAELSEPARQFLLDRGDASPAIRAYKAAETAMTDPVTKAVQDRTSLNRLEGRVLTNLAWVCILKRGPPTRNDLDDAETFLDRANDAFKKNEFWNVFIEGGNFGQVPRAFKDIKRAGLKGDDARNLKRLFSQTIRDWQAMHLLKAEMTAFRERSIDEEAVNTAEQDYDRIVGFLKTQYGDDHPRLQAVRLSRARWFLAASRSAKEKPELRQSLLKDCVGDLDKLKGLGPSDMLQKQVIELSARMEMLETPEKDGGPAGEERIACDRRVSKLREEVEAEIARRTKKRLEARPLNVDEK
jgi:hypothetical protein